MVVQKHVSHNDFNQEAEITTVYVSYLNASIIQVWACLTLQTELM